MDTISVTSERYTINGKEYPRLSVVTSQRRNIPLEGWRKRVGEEEADRISTAHADYGTLVHEMTAYEDLGFDLGDFAKRVELDKLICKEMWLIPHWCAWRDWKKEYVKEIIAVEVVVWSERYWCAGRVDRVLVMRGDRSPSIGDLKTGSLYDEIGVDLAGYRYMWNERNPKCKANRRLAIHLPRENPGYIRVKPYGNKGDEGVWKEMCRDYEMVNGG